MIFWYIKTTQTDRVSNVTPVAHIFSIFSYHLLLHTWYRFIFHHATFNDLFQGAIDCSDHSLNVCEVEVCFPYPTKVIQSIQSYAYHNLPSCRALKKVVLSFKTRSAACFCSLVHTYTVTLLALGTSNPLIMPCRIRLFETRNFQFTKDFVSTQFIFFSDFVVWVLMLTATS